MRAVTGHIIAWAICIAIGLLVGEIAGAILFYRQQGQLVYANSRTSSPTWLQEEGTTRQYSQRLHPYLGFAGPYDLKSPTWATNNLGFPQATGMTVPFAIGPRDLAVFVFGGSVASNLVAPPQGGTSLARALQERLTERNVIMYSMAQGSGKQPQQLMALAMLLAMGQHVDVVVNLDGLNDLAMGYSNYASGVHPIFPSASIMWGIANTLASDGKMTTEFYRIAADILEAKTGIARRTEGANNSRFGMKYLYHKTIISFYLRQKIRAEMNYAGGMRSAPESLERAKRLTGMDLPVDANGDGLAMAFDIWLKSDEAMAALSRSVGAKYVHVIQPNQYFSKRKFSPEEARIALSMPATEVMRIGAERGYAMLEKNADLIAKHGIVSGILILDEAPGVMYFDNCCHYSTAGETIVANFVADQVVRSLSEANK